MVIHRLLFIPITAFLLSSTLATKCTLTQREPEKAFPSLIKCYRNNINSCCVSAHDDVIADAMSSLLPSACERSFKELELYFCYACHFTEPDNTYPNTTPPTLKVCKEYAERLWGASLDAASTKFDSCGMTTYFRSGAQSSQIVIPSLTWKTAYEFFAEVKPPLFEDYEIQIVEDNTDCFNVAQKVKGLITIVGAMLLLMMVE